MSGKVFDLEERLLEYAADIIRFTDDLPRTRAGNHVAAQLLRAGTSPLPNHGEAQAAESLDDFIHKMSVCLKELREANRWLRLSARVPLAKAALVQSLIVETNELTAIFVASLRTARRGQKRSTR